MFECSFFTASGAYHSMATPFYVHWQCLYCVCHATVWPTEWIVGMKPTCLVYFSLSLGSWWQFGWNQFFRRKAGCTLNKGLKFFSSWIDRFQIYFRYFSAHIRAIALYLLSYCSTPGGLFTNHRSCCPFLEVLGPIFKLHSFFIHLIGNFQSPIYSPLFSSLNLDNVSTM